VFKKELSPQTAELRTNKTRLRRTQGAREVSVRQGVCFRSGANDPVGTCQGSIHV
jgi:hypothetical protein